jgi:endo-1,4-beta-xylanase
MFRRQVLAGLAASVVPVAAPALKDRAAARGLLFGSMVEASRLASDPAFATAIVRECAIVVPGVEAKWAATEAAEGHFTFERLNAVARFAETHGLALRLHNLVWGMWNPPWVARAQDEGRGEAIMTRHIAAVAGHMRGRALAWDVVNEPADPRWPSGPEGLCRIGWWRAMGPAYVERAFHAAHEADPRALLFVNDDWLEYAQCAEKRRIYLRLLEGWIARGVPVHGFGIEAHLRADIAFDAGPYRQFLKALGDLGLIIHITELDVQDRALPADSAVRDQIVADMAGRFLDTALDEHAVRAVLCWGLSDRAGDLDRDPATRRLDGLPSRGLPLDTLLRRKPLYDAIGRALDHAPDRRGR